MNKINWGIIGCGDVAEIKSGPAFQRIEHSELHMVMRRNAAKAKDFAQRHKVPHWTNNADEILLSEDINAIYIATPPSTHLNYALQALNQGKHVYLETHGLGCRTGKKNLHCRSGKQWKAYSGPLPKKIACFLKSKNAFETTGNW